MTHQQILDKIPGKVLVKSLEEDISRLTWQAMVYHKEVTEQLP